ncbi:LETM1-like [Macleaya cordata]|uniref:LETM1-like n=1 Tax=Macleaya cordata TaxID=56857 RepID=A0A200QVE4_MACCD|nr:LETM1-like [Macleaya cordata]
MAIKLQHQSFIASSTSNPCLSRKPIRIHFFCKKVVDLNHLLCNWGSPRKRCRMKHGLLEYDKSSHCGRWGELRKYRPTFCKARRLGNFSLLASADDGVTVNGTPQSSPSSDVEEMRIKLDKSLQGEDHSDGLIQSLHDAARVFELGIKEQSSLSKTSWFSTAWLGVDKNAWVKALSYQAALYSLLQAASEISSRGDRRDRDINVFVQRSLLRQSAPLESLIRDELSAKQPEAYEWFWSEQLPMVVTTFVNYFERDPRFTAATSVCGKGLTLASGCSSDISLLMLALTCVAAITKLGPAKVSCPQFFSLIPDETGRLMDMLVEFIPIHQAYYSMKDIGLRREFLVHFGPRAASCRVNDRGAEELAFWVELVQQQLQRAIDREKIWSRLTTCESIEVLEKDLAIFGFFIALGRSTQSFLFANNFDVIDDPIESFIRYLIGGSVLYYPQLSSISSYQLYVEVVCEELEWLPFYPVDEGSVKRSRSHSSKGNGPPNAAAIPQVLDVCSYWMQSFIKYSKWLENPSNIKAAAFLSRGNFFVVLWLPLTFCYVFISSDFLNASLEIWYQALENVEEALKRLEELLQELHVSSSNHGKEHLKAACSDLERIRKLKKEAEFLEASFRAKAASLQQEAVEGLSVSSISNQRQYLKRKNGKSAIVMPDSTGRDEIPADRVVSNPRGLWSFLVPYPAGGKEPGSSEGECSEQATAANMGDADSESNEIRRFELLRHELIELEKRVQRSSQQSENEQDINGAEGIASYVSKAAGGGLVQVQKKESIIGKSIDKLKETSTDVWQGTQLLAIDTTTAMGLLRRVLTGDELTEKEKKALRRTLTDLASVVPIGILMLLPVTAVGHAAMLAAIQRYVPSLIPSTYGPERLDLLRKLEKVKEMERNEMKPDENVEEDSLRSSPENI